MQMPCQKAKRVDKNTGFFIGAWFASLDESTLVAIVLMSHVVELNTISVVLLAL